MRKKAGGTRGPSYGEREAKAGLREALPEIAVFPSQFRGYEVVIEIPEFTSVCPKTGLPDFGKLVITYEPGPDCLELKSLKEYLLAYRNLGIFQENVVNRVLEDIVRACRPVRATVRGDFNARGGLLTSVEARYPRPAGRRSAASS